MTAHLQALKESFRFESDEAESRFYDEVEREILETLADDEPLISHEEVNQGVKAIIARAAAAKAAARKA